MYNDGKWRVSVDGQLDMPFDEEKDARAFAAYMTNESYDCLVFSCPLLPEKKNG